MASRSDDVASEEQDSAERSKLDYRSDFFCTHNCLKGLVHNQALSPDLCPNQAAHSHRLLSREQIFASLASQLCDGEAEDAGLTELNRSGRSGVLYKVRIVKTGHVLVAIGYQQEDYDWLQNELAIYARLQDMQGSFVPVCCGSISVSEPILSASDRVIQHLLLLSYAGDALDSATYADPEAKTDFARFKPLLLPWLHEMHKRLVIHGNVERRNMVFEEASQHLMLIDSERSRLYEKGQPCNPAQPCQKKRRNNKGKRVPCMYSRELIVAEEALMMGSRYNSFETTEGIASVIGDENKARKTKRQRTVHKQRGRIKRTNNEALRNMPGVDEPTAPSDHSAPHEKKHKRGRSPSEPFNPVWTNRLRRNALREGGGQT
ncbi:hypothetical protein QM012_004177 [Aureobasidium pullulans]|uniref:Protein kinase domain-containing protein n=1 Tax=Aureobasidium pullulans TaxID=5580 RepID=A0ABR0TSC4_AURPU